MPGVEACTAERLSTSTRTRLSCRKSRVYVLLKVAQLTAGCSPLRSRLVLPRLLRRAGGRSADRAGPGSAGQCLPARRRRWRHVRLRGIHVCGNALQQRCVQADEQRRALGGWAVGQQVAQRDDGGQRGGRVRLRDGSGAGGEAGRSQQGPAEEGGDQQRAQGGGVRLALRVEAYQ